jgi:serine/threonine protein kinase
MAFDINNNPQIHAVHTAISTHQHLFFKALYLLLDDIEKNHTEQLWQQQPYADQDEKYRSTIFEYQDLLNPFPLTISAITDKAIKHLQILACYLYTKTPTEKPSLNYFLIIPIEIDPSSQCSLQIGVPITIDFMTGAITLDFSHLYKMKTIAISPDGESVPNLYVLSALYPTMKMYQYARPAANRELDPDNSTDKTQTTFCTTDMTIYFVVIPFFIGTPLNHITKKNWDFSKTTLLYWLQISHELALVHLSLHMWKDLKPHNIIVELNKIYFIDLEQPQHSAQQPLRHLGGFTPGFDAPTVGAFNSPASTSPTLVRRRLSSTKSEDQILTDALIKEPCFTERMKDILKQKNKPSVDNFLSSEECRADLFSMGVTFLKMLLPDDELFRLQSEIHNWTQYCDNRSTVEVKAELVKELVQKFCSHPHIQDILRKNENNLDEKMILLIMKLYTATMHEIKKLNAVNVYQQLYELAKLQGLEQQALALLTEKPIYQHLYRALNFHFSASNIDVSSDHLSIQQLHTALKEDCKLRALLCQTIENTIQKINKEQLVQQLPNSPDYTKYHLNEHGRILMPVVNSYDLVTVDTHGKFIFRHLKLLACYKYGEQRQHIHYFLITDTKAAKKSANQLFLAFEIKQDLSFNTSYTIYFAHTYKVKIINIESKDAPVANTLPLIDLELMHKMYPTDQLYYYARPINASEYATGLAVTNTTNIHFIVSNYINGMPLNVYLNKYHKQELALPKETIVWIMLVICHDLYVINTSGRIFQDLKLENVLIDPSNMEIRLFDFEQAPLIDSKPLNQNAGFTLIYASIWQRSADREQFKTPIKRANAIREKNPSKARLNLAYHLASAASSTSSPRMQRTTSITSNSSSSDEEQETQKGLNYDPDDIYAEINKKAAYFLTEECLHDLHTLGMLYLEMLLGEYEFHYLLGIADASFGKKDVIDNNRATLQDLKKFYQKFIEFIKFHTKLKNTRCSKAPEDLLQIALEMIQPTINDRKSIAQHFSELRDKFADVGNYTINDINQMLDNHAADDTSGLQDIQLSGK